MFNVEEIVKIISFMKLIEDTKNENQLLNGKVTLSEDTIKNLVNYLNFDIVYPLLMAATYLTQKKFFERTAGFPAGQCV